MRACRRFVRELNRLYRAQPALYEVDFDYTGFEWIDFADVEKSVHLVPAPRGRPGGLHRVRLQLHAGAAARTIAIGVPEPGYYQEILNTDAAHVRRQQHGQCRRRDVAADSRSHGRPAQHFDHACRRWPSSPSNAACRALMRRTTSSLSAAATTAWSRPLIWRAPARRCWCSSAARCSAAARSPRKSGRAISVSTGAYLVSLLQERIVRELELERFGYHVHPEGSGVFLRLSRRPPSFLLAGRTEDAGRNREVFRARRRGVSEVRSVSGAAGRRGGIAAARHAAGTAAEEARRLHRISEAARRDSASSGAREITGLVKIFTQSAADLLDEWFESPEIKVTLATDGVIGANGGPRSAGTAYILMHHCMGGVARQARALGIRAGRHGRGLRSHRGVGAQQGRGDSHECAGRAACWSAMAARMASCCENGDELHADVVASNLDPKADVSQAGRTATSRSGIPRVDRALSRRRHFAQDEPRARRAAGFHGAARRARSAARRDHAHLPVDRLRGARLG